MRAPLALAALALAALAAAFVAAATPAAPAAATGSATVTLSAKWDAGPLVIEAAEFLVRERERERGGRREGIVIDWGGGGREPRTGGHSLRSPRLDNHSF
jgi:ABC-type glycerol-3-phosphate transport system substrate-binding protein